MRWVTTPERIERLKEIAGPLLDEEGQQLLDEVCMCANAHSVSANCRWPDGRERRVRLFGWTRADEARITWKADVDDEQLPPYALAAYEATVPASWLNDVKTGVES